MIKLNYINKIKANLKIHSTKKAANILDGSYKSMYKGKSMNFDNLREYTINDDIKDIDWKSSARSGSILVKQFVAEKKHNVLLVVDSGIKMNADTDKHENKKELALYTAGTIGFLAMKGNDYVAMIYQGNKVEFKPFKNNLYNLEQYLCDYHANEYNKETNIEELLKYVVNKIPKRKIVFIITDIEGINKIETQTLKKLKFTSDVFLININDNFMFGDNIYDVEEKEFIPKVFLKDKRLNDVEKFIKEQLIENNKKRIHKLNISLTSISSLEEMDKKMIELLEGHKNE